MIQKCKANLELEQTVDTLAYSITANKRDSAEGDKIQKHSKDRVPSIGASMVDFFTSAEIKEHIASLKQKCGQVLLGFCWRILICPCPALLFWIMETTCLILRCCDLIQSKARIDKLPAQGQCSEAKDGVPCQLCEYEDIAFAPQAYCAGCGLRIKGSWPFWTMKGEDTNLYYICKSCFDACKGDVIQVEGESYNISKLTKGETLEEQNEPVWFLIE